MFKSGWMASMFVLALASTSLCQESTDEPAASSGPWERDHELKVGGKQLRYRSIFDHVPLYRGGDAVVAELFHTAYFVVDSDGAPDPSRPVIFAYNGGPGSASYWLHMGVMGPKRVVTSKVGPQGAPPYPLEDNSACLLDVADIVMVDPVGTGLSRPVGDGEGADFWGVDEDARSIAEFVRRFLSRHGRWNSPRYLLGESYGTTRSAVLADRLQRDNLDLNGVVLVSAVLDFRTIQFAQGDVIPFVVTVPSYAVTSAYHGVLPGGAPQDLAAFMQEVEAWARTDYATAVLAGSAVDPEHRRRVLAQMHRYTGLSEAYLDRSDLRVTASQYEQQILNERGLVVGRLDARFTGPSGDVRASRPSHDPQSTAISSAYTSAFNDYLRNVLGYDGAREYVPGGRAGPWNWGRGDGGFGGGAVNVAPDLARVLRRNPELEVLLVNGIYDLATPYYAAVWSLDNLNLPPTLRDNIHRADFAAGHMMYVEQSLLPQWRRALLAFLQRTSGR